MEERLCEREVVERLAAGDMDALGEIYDAHARRLFAHALWMTRSRGDAEDVVHAVFAKLASMGEQLLGIRNLRAYINQMAHRECVDLMMRQRRRAEEPIDSALFVRDGADPAGAAEIAEMEDRLRELDPEQRETVYLHLFEGLTFREVGKVMGVSIFTAASRYRLAIGRLRRESGV